MILTILGIILLLIPFVLLYRFKNKSLGFAYILSFVLLYHVITAVVLQFFGVFKYWLVIIVNLIFAIFVLFYVDYKKFLKSLKKFKIDWMLIVIIVILSIALYSVHYNYTGKVTTTLEPFEEVSNLRYDYPYFSDEWSAISLIQYSISSGKLPLVNPLWFNEPFVNIGVPFFSFTSQIMLLLNLEPLVSYSIFSFFSGLLICILVYFILRCKIDRFSSAIASLSILYIVNSGGLAGIWNLIPLIMGIICLLLSFIFILNKKDTMVLVTSFLTLIFYPPLFVFSIFSLLFYFYPKKRKKLGAYFIICSIVALFLFFFAVLTSGGFEHALTFLFSKLFYPTFTEGFIPDFSIWKIVPIPILFFAVLGLFKNFKKKLWLIAPIFVGLIYWFLYSKVLWRFIIGYERAVMTASILITILAGFGIYYFVRYLRKFDFVNKYKLTEIGLIIALALFFIFSFSYTNNDKWIDLKLYSISGDEVFDPASPANIYLHEDDLKLFDFKDKIFLSTSWKGLVIGVATENYPLHSKFSTLSNRKGDLEEFLLSNCKRKYALSKLSEIDYIYSPPFNCEGFELKNISSEGLYLYEVK
jgi:hypothetical protein